MADEKMLERVRALLYKAESTDSEPERESLTAKAAGRQANMHDRRAAGAGGGIQALGR